MGVSSMSWHLAQSPPPVAPWKPEGTQPLVDVLGGRPLAGESKVLAGVGVDGGRLAKGRHGNQPGEDRRVE